MSKTIEQMLKLLDKADKSYADANTDGAKLIYDGDCILSDQGITVDPGTYPKSAGSIETPKIKKLSLRCSKHSLTCPSMCIWRSASKRRQSSLHKRPYKPYPQYKNVRV